MDKELLDETTVVAYLTQRGIISGPAEVEELTGGVSKCSSWRQGWRK